MPSKETSPSPLRATVQIILVPLANGNQISAAPFIGMLAGSVESTPGIPTARACDDETGGVASCSLLRGVRLSDQGAKDRADDEEREEDAACRRGKESE